MLPSSLKVLADNRNALLLAEVAALLHDVGKFCNLHIEAHTKGGTRKWANEHAYKAIVDDPKSQIQLNPQAGSLKKPKALNNVLNAGNPKAADFLAPDFKNFLANNTLTILGETYTLAELIMLGTPGFATDKNRSDFLDGKSGWLAAVLGVCHSEAHVDKQDPAKGEGEQTWPNVFMSDAFGFEKEKVVVDASPNSLDARLKNLPIHDGRNAILNALMYGLGDIRRPINEVLLSDWGWIVASLFKSAVAGALVKNQQFAIREWKSWKDQIIDHDLHWRILRVNFDVLGLYAKAVRIADVLGYQHVVEQACESVKQLIEEEYPLGNEIYRDTTGIYFTFPDLDLPVDLAQEIRCRVEEVEVELAPRIAVMLGDGDTAQEQLKKILGKARREALESLAQPFDDQNLSVCWQQQWKTVGQGNWELCPVCRLRPKKEDEQACPTCLKRRTPRVKEWLKDLSTTIWTDEVADTNGRLALIVGQFGLDDWLNGQLLQTLTVTEPQNGNAVLKNPSPARLRRVWETTRAFWQQVLPTEKKKEDRRQSLVEQILTWPQGRLSITPRNGVPQRVVPHHTYDLIVNNVAVSVVWDGQRFLTADNLDYLAKPEQLGQPLTQCLIQGKAYAIEEPAGYGAKNKRLGEITIGEVKEERTSYLPAIPILAEPRTFMALVPADRALQIVQAIKCKYEREMGKVRNRLPLTLGVIYFGRRTPLAAALEAGRRMLRRQVTVETWRVEKLETLEKGDCLPADWPRCVALTLSDGTRSIRLEISTVMGDKETKDVWYPYWRLEGGDTQGRQRWFKGADDGTWVHVCDLRPGDRVQFMPSTFDYEYLDTTARRFEIFYGEDGQRCGKDKPQRPYLLEEVSEIQSVWQALGRLKKSQIYQIEASIEAKRRAWSKPRGQQALELPSEDVFRRFVQDVLREAETYSESLEKAALSGMLSDALELYLTIAKEEVDHDK